MFKFDIAKDFKVGGYTYNTTAPVVTSELITAGNTTIPGYRALFYNGEVALVNSNPILPAYFEDAMQAIGNREHNWKTKNGYYESYYKVDGDKYVRYIWNWSNKQSSVELVTKIENCFLPITKPLILTESVEDMSTIIDSLVAEEALALENVTPHTNKILEDIMAAGKTPSFQSEIQRMLLESSSTLVAIARTISHAYMPLTYKQLVGKIYVQSAINYYSAE